MSQYFVAWWNLENLFDVATSRERPSWLKSRLKRELKGWNAAALDVKLKQLARPINEMNDGKGPDIIGVCEVENETVLRKLVAGLDSSRRYEIVHKDTNDQRGIDIAFIYDTDVFDVETGADGKPRVFSHEVLKRTATRDLVQVNFVSKATGEPLIIIGNHWPARSAGVYESEPYRIIAGETLSYYLSRIQELRGKNVAVLAMGDFNDEPFNRSLMEYALSTFDRTRVTRGRAPNLWNLMWKLYDTQRGSYFYGGQPNLLDQFLASKGLVTGKGNFKINSTDVSLYNPSYLCSDKTTRRKPLRHGRPSKSYNPDGFSDHFPIVCTVRDS